MRFPVLHPNPRLGAHARVRGTEDDVAHTVAPSGATVATIPTSNTDQHYTTSGERWRTRSPSVLIKAENDVLGRLALAPLVAMVCAVECVSAGLSSILREQERTVSGDDRMQVQDVFVQRVPERVVLALVLFERCRLGRAGAQSVSYLFSVRCQFGGSLADGWI